MVRLLKQKTEFPDILNMLFLLLLSLTTLYPFVYLALISISPVEEIMKSSIILIPKALSWSAYEYVFRATGIGNAYIVTIFITVAGTMVNLIMSCLGGHVLAHRQIPGRNLFMTMIIITMIFQGGLIPFYLIVKGLGMYNTLWALIIPNAINTFWMIVLRNFFQSIPASLAESARIDGCSEYRILGQLILPLSTPVLATLALFYGVGHWNQYFNAIIFINDTKLMPLQVLIRSMYQSATSTLDQDALPPPIETVRAATIMVATLPILCVYPFLQRYFVQGIMVGAVKG